MAELLPESKNPWAVKQEFTEQETKKLLEIQQIQEKIDQAFDFLNEEMCLFLENGEQTYGEVTDVRLTENGKGIELDVKLPDQSTLTIYSEL